MSNVVSIHPYFKAREGKIESLLEVVKKLVEKTSEEKDCLYYDVTVNGDEFFVREAYRGAGGLLAHAKNVAELIAEVLQLANLTRMEIHGPAGELNALRSVYTPLGAVYYVYECGLGRPV